MLTVKGIHKIYRKQVYAVRDISFQLERGMTLGLAGESGAGKSTLARLLCGLEPWDWGTLEIDGQVYNPKPGFFQKPRGFHKQVQLIFQDTSGSLDPRLSVYQSLKESLDKYAPGPRIRKHPQAETLLEQVGLTPDILKKYPHELSGGQRQRVVIARALAVGPDYLICDEPVSSLDPDTRSQILRLLIAIQEQNKMGCLFISHDLSLTAQISKRIMVMFAGRIIEELDAGAIRYAAHPYTNALFAEMLDREPVSRDSLAAGIAQTGCAYSLQCPYTGERCKQEEPRRKSLGESCTVWCHYPLERQESC